MLHVTLNRPMRGWLLAKASTEMMISSPGLPSASPSRILKDAASESICEGEPLRAFEFDVMVLELHSLLRRNGIEPSDALVLDLIRWKDYPKSSPRDHPQPSLREDRPEAPGPVG